MPYVIGFTSAKFTPGALNIMCEISRAPAWLETSRHTTWYWQGGLDGVSSTLICFPARRMGYSACQYVRIFNRQYSASVSYVRLRNVPHGHNLQRSTLAGVVAYKAGSGEDACSGRAGRSADSSAVVNTILFASVGSLLTKRLQK